MTKIGNRQINRKPDRDVSQNRQTEHKDGFSYPEFRSSRQTLCNLLLQVMKYIMEYTRFEVKKLI